MKLGFEESQSPYSSGTQKARAWTKAWVSAWAYCPHCGNAKMSQFPNNSPVADFLCGSCSEEFELKSQQASSARRLLHVPSSGQSELKMHFIDDAEVTSVLSFPVLIDAIEQAHRRPKIEVLDGYLGNEREQYVVRSAADPGRYMATKMFTSFPANLAKGAMPAVQAVCVLFDGADGRPLAVMDGTEITHWRTAADSALGARLLARADSETLLVVGAGEMSRWLVRAHKTVRPSLRRVLIWNRTEQRAHVLAALLRDQGLDIEIVGDIDAATREADIITTCTRAHAPLIKGAKLQPGVHLDLVGGYTPQTREADDEAARRSRVFVDRRESAFDGVGDILQPIASGAIREQDVLGDLYDLAGGTVAGRLSPKDITFFKNAGGGHLDLMTCETVFHQLGTKLK